MRTNNFHKLFLPLVLSGVLLASCKIKQEALKTDITIPDNYEHASSYVKVDTFKTEQAVQPESWRTFFTDSKLVTLIDSALQRNYDMQAAYQTLMQSKAGLAYTKGILLPDLNLNIGAGVRKYGDYTVDGVGNYDTQYSTNLNEKQRLDRNIQDYTLGLGTSWEIDIWGKLRNQKKAALYKFLASTEGRNLVMTNVISEVAEAYYSLMILDRELEIIRENMVLQEKAVNSVSAQKEFGKETELAVELVSAQLLQARGMVIELEQQMIVQENRINVLLGRYPQRIERSSLKNNTDISKAASVSIPAELLENRPDIRSAAQNLRAQNADVKAAKAAFYPTLTLSANVGYNAFRASLLFESPASLFYNVIGGLTTPLLNRRQLKADLMRSKASQAEAYIRYEKAILIGFTEVFETLKTAQKYEDLSSIKTEQVETLKKSIETSQALFMSGRATYLEIITAQENYLKAQKELLDVYSRKTRNNIQLYKATGGGWK